MYSSQVFFTFICFLKANIAHHQMAASYDKKEIIIGGDFIVHLWELVKLIYLTKNA